MTRVYSVGSYEEHQKPKSTLWQAYKSPNKPQQKVAALIRIFGKSRTSFEAAAIFVNLFKSGYSSVAIVTGSAEVCRRLKADRGQAVSYKSIHVSKSRGSSLRPADRS
jgi:hypothetical protein